MERAPVEEVVLDIHTWIEKLETIGLRPVARYSQIEQSAYIYIPLALQTSTYPQELLNELESLGITKLGAYNIVMGEDPGTMGLTGAIVSAGATPGIVPTNAATLLMMQGLGYTWIYLSRPQSNSSAVMPTGMTIAKTAKWSMSPNAYREAYPNDNTIGIPAYRTPKGE